MAAPSVAWGSRVVTTVSVTPGQVVVVDVGGQPGGNNATGFNGGASGGEFADGGGDASDVRLGGTAIADRVVVAGGGGGTSEGQARTVDRAARAVRSSAAQAGTAGSCSTGGGGGTNSAGGAGGTGGAAGSAGSFALGGAGGHNGTDGGGGGGGYYGGGGGAGCSYPTPASGGGGGSDYVESFRHIGRGFPGLQRGQRVGNDHLSAFHAVSNAQHRVRELLLHRLPPVLDGAIKRDVYPGRCTRRSRRRHLRRPGQPCDRHCPGDPRAGFLAVDVGGQPGGNNATGFNGGASGGEFAYGGGDASDVRVSGTALADGVVVAGGGGGTSEGANGVDGVGGSGGSLSGGPGRHCWVLLYRRWRGGPTARAVPGAREAPPALRVRLHWAARAAITAPTAGAGAGVTTAVVVALGAATPRQLRVAVAALTTSRAPPHRSRISRATTGNGSVTIEWEGGPGSPVVPQGTEPGPGGILTSGVGNDGHGGGSFSVAAHPCTCTDPVDAATGDFFETATDLSLPGAGLPLEFTRTYDAQSAQNRSLEAHLPRPGVWLDGQPGYDSYGHCDHGDPNGGERGSARFHFVRLGDVACVVHLGDQFLFDGTAGRGHLEPQLRWDLEFRAYVGNPDDIYL